MGATDDALFDDIVERELFIDLVSHGTPPDLAGLEVGWTPRRTKRNMADPEFAELIAYAKIHRDDRIEKVLYEMALNHNFPAVQLILLNRRASEFRDVKKIEVVTTGSVVVEHVHSLKQGLRELMIEAGAEAFQIGGVLDVESSEDTD